MAPKLLKPGESDELPPRFMVEVTREVYEATLFPNGTVGYVPIGRPVLIERRYFNVKED